jgi:hypothetical protein
MPAYWPEFYLIAFASLILTQVFSRFFSIRLPRVLRGVWLERGKLILLSNPKAMPRILPTFAAVVIVGVCIAFNTMRYPIVWKMVGPQAVSASSENSDPTAEVASSATPAPPAPASVAPSLAAASPVPPAPQSMPTEMAESAQPEPAPIVLPKEELAAAEIKNDTGIKSISDSVSQEKAVESRAEEESSDTLVPVAKESESADVRPENIRRLPPVDPETTPSNQVNNADYPSSSYPIYPSTGM